MANTLIAKNKLCAILYSSASQPFPTHEPLFFTFDSTIHVVGKEMMPASTCLQISGCEPLSIRRQRHLPCRLFFSVSHSPSSLTTFQPTQRFHLLVHNSIGLQTRVDNPSLLDHCIFSQSLHEDLQTAMHSHVVLKF